MEKIIQFPKYSDIYAKDTINLYMKLSKINKLRNRQKSRNNHKKRKFQKNSENNLEELHNRFINCLYGSFRKRK